ncbi:conserved hypothetical protein [Burkholderia diffusa]|uniref:hypothetical protein n=1 Tax=Burkholderia diffusa TaxID=488732 RepID=UPI001CB36F56|nr:hypothetical protein [Burkholderia diffusa]CAG9260974.1 conserved hypothetical protein [Burkholderia diffusa]
MATKRQETICGADLERWRIKTGLNRAEAADAFGLPKAKFEFITKSENASQQITDPAVAMLYQIYLEHPESSPVSAPPSVKEFFEFLGMEDAPSDREKFAILIGRSTPSAYRLMLHEGTPSRPVVRWIEAIRRLKLTPKQALRVMTEIVSTVGERQNVGHVLVRGWTKKEDASD